MRSKLHLASTIIDRILSILLNLLLYSTLEGKNLSLDPIVYISLIAEFNQIITEIRIYKSTVNRLVSLLKDLCLIV